MRKTKLQFLKNRISTFQLVALAMVFGAGCGVELSDVTLAGFSQGESQALTCSAIESGLLRCYIPAGGLQGALAFQGAVRHGEHLRFRTLRCGGEEGCNKIVEQHDMSLHAGAGWLRFLAFSQHNAKLPEELELAIDFDMVADAAEEGDDVVLRELLWTHTGHALEGFGHGTKFARGQSSYGLGTCNLPGDFNGDTSLNVLDIVSLANHILGADADSTEFNACGDMNGDSELNVSDVVMLANAVLGLDPAGVWGNLITTVNGNTSWPVEVFEMTTNNDGSLTIDPFQNTAEAAGALSNSFALEAGETYRLSYDLSCANGSQDCIDFTVNWPPMVFSTTIGACATWFTSNQIADALFVHHESHMGHNAITFVADPNLLAETLTTDQNVSFDVYDEENDVFNCDFQFALNTYNEINPSPVTIENLKLIPLSEKELVYTFEETTGPAEEQFAGDIDLSCTSTPAFPCETHYVKPSWKMRLHKSTQNIAKVRSNGFQLDGAAVYALSFHFEWLNGAPDLSEHALRLGTDFQALLPPDALDFLAVDRLAFPRS